MDQYEKLEKIGEGTYGKVRHPPCRPVSHAQSWCIGSVSDVGAAAVASQVYKAKDINTGHLVALKKTRLDVGDTWIGLHVPGRRGMAVSNRGFTAACLAVRRADGGGGRAIHHAARGVAAAHAEREQPHRQVSRAPCRVMWSGEGRPGDSCGMMLMTMTTCWSYLPACGPPHVDQPSMASKLVSTNAKLILHVYVPAGPSLPWRSCAAAVNLLPRGGSPAAALPCSSHFHALRRLHSVEHTEENGKPCLYLVSRLHADCMLFIHTLRAGATRCCCSMLQVFEYLSTDLKKWMDRGGKGPAYPLPLGTVKNLMYQLVKGLAYCHKHGILHRCAFLSAKYA